MIFSEQSGNDFLPHCDKTAELCLIKPARARPRRAPAEAPAGFGYGLRARSLGGWPALARGTAFLIPMVCAVSLRYGPTLIAHFVRSQKNNYTATTAKISIENFRGSRWAFAHRVIVFLLSHYISLFAPALRYATQRTLIFFPPKKNNQNIDVRLSARLFYFGGLRPPIPPTY